MISKREAVNRLKFYFTSTKWGKRIPYRTGSSVIRWFSGTKYAREEYFKRKVLLINTFLQTTGIRESSPALIQEMFNAFFMKKWRAMSISYLSEKRFKKYIKINNLETFKEYYSKGNGIILLSSHYGLPEICISSFPRLGYSNFYTVVGSQGAESEKFTGVNPNYESKTLVFDNFSDVELFKLLMKAKHVLNDGGIVHLLGDGYHGKSNMTFPFIGKLRGFRGSYAELALSTNAEIIPVFARTGKHDRVFMDLGAPLDKGTEDQSREERTKHIVSQYVDQLEEAWKTNPQFINWGHMEKYLHHVDKE